MNENPTRVTTTDAIPKTLQRFGADSPLRSLFKEDRVSTVEMRITARSPDGIQALFMVHAHARLVGRGIPVLVAEPPSTFAAGKEPRSASWDVALATTPEGFELVVVGADGATIGWHVDSSELEGEVARMDALRARCTKGGEA